MHADVHDTRRSFLKVLGTGAAGLAVSGADVNGQTPQATPNVSSPRAMVGEFGRIVVLIFQRGDKLREGIRDKLKELGIPNAVLVSAIGTLDKAVFHRITSTGPKAQQEVITVEAPIEFASISGIVADGEPHFHFTFQDMNRAYAAHLEDGSTVLYVGEVVLAELKGVQKIRG
jgi:predicted DNA-binding protein with PD1-like motif